MISPEFKRTVESGDSVGVRSVLLDYLIIDRTFKKFDEALEYANERLDVIQPHDDTNVGYPIDNDCEKWDERYLDLQSAELMFNFSQDRIDHIKKVIQKVLPPNAETPQNKSANRPKMNNSAHGGEQGSPSRTGRRVISETEIPSNKETETVKKPMMQNAGTVAVAGGILIAAAGAVAAEPVIVGTGIVLAGVGVGIKIANRR
ncbi:MAG: hypothetical protein NC395_01115 [Prevotella sp.]|nr:hypothetical protein [Prevotella sp.]